MNLQRALLAAGMVVFGSPAWSQGGVPLGYLQLELSPADNAGPLRDSSDLQVSLGSSPQTAQLSQGGGFVWENAVYTPNTTSLQFFDPVNVSGLTGQQLVTCGIDFKDQISWGNVYGSRKSLAVSPLTGGGQGGNSSNNGLGSSSALLIEELWKQRFDGTILSDLMTHSANLQNDVAAFQLAVWKLAYDPGIIFYSGHQVDVTNAFFTTGNLQVDNPSNPVVTTATTWLNGLVDNPSSSQLANLVAINGPNFPDQVTEINQRPGQNLSQGRSTTTDNPVPEPTSGLIWLLAAPCAALRRWRRQGVR